MDNPTTPAPVEARNPPAAVPHGGQPGESIALPPEDGPRLPPRLDVAEERLAGRYRRALRGDDPILGKVARAQLARLSRRSSPRPPGLATGGGGVDLAAMIEAAVGELVARPNGDREGPCPWHSSRSGRCLVVFAGAARWWCRACRRGGDAVAWLALSEGISIAQARRRLRLHPAPRRARRRPILRREVVP